MKCKYCGLSAGFFSRAHKECKEKHEQGMQDLQASLSSYFNGNDTIDGLYNKISMLQTDNFISQADLEDCCLQLGKQFVEKDNQAVTEQMLQALDTFMQKSGIQLSTLNKKGELDKLAPCFFQGVLANFFTGGEPIDKVKGLAQKAEALLPVPDDKKEELAMQALDKASADFLSDSMLTSDEKDLYDTFAEAFQLPVDNLPKKYQDSYIEKVKQSVILGKIQAGQALDPRETTQPIILGAREHVIWEYNDVTMYQEKITKEWVGGRSGASIRIAKGVYYHVGGTKGQPIEHSSMEEKGVGALVLTDKNIIFYSVLKSIKVPYKKLISVVPYSDGIELQREGVNAQRLIFQGFDSWFLMNLLSSINN